MSPQDQCACGASKQANRNCAVVDDDGKAVQCVGPWALDKHNYLSRYIEATWAARERFRSYAGAGFLDLFAGPGRARVRDSGHVADGSPLIALGHTRAPFTRVVLCDLDSDNVDALRHRTAGDPRVEVVHGDCNEQVRSLIAKLPWEGLNVSLVDPFGATSLHWETLATLGRVPRMDLVIHFPTNAIKRNFDHDGFPEAIDRLLGTQEWRSTVKRAQDVPALIDVLHARLASIGYDGEKVRRIAVKNTTGGILYHLAFASKHKLGNKIWQSIAKTTPAGQTGWNF